MRGRADIGRNRRSVDADDIVPAALDQVMGDRGADDPPQPSDDDICVRRHISHHAERKVLDFLQIGRALSIDCDDPRLKAALTVMEDNSDGSLQIADLARRIGLSRRQLERLFVAELHDTPAAICKRLRLERARQRLALSRAPMAEIAFDLGFDNVSHFARLFKRLQGLPPGRFGSAAHAAETAPSA